MDDVETVEGGRELGSPDQIPLGIEGSDRPGDLHRREAREPGGTGFGEPAVEEGEIGTAAVGQCRGQLADVRPDPAGRREPELVDLEADLHGPHASIQTQP
jgi:hypothetical protein